MEKGEIAVGIELKCRLNPRGWEILLMLPINLIIVLTLYFLFFIGEISLF
jgi:hypothetical protein